MICLPIGILYLISSMWTRTPSTNKVTRFMQWFRVESWPFMPVVYIVWYLARAMRDNEGFQPTLALWLCFNVYFWWRDKDDRDEDRWKRRRKKIRETLARVGTRLVPVAVKG